MDSVELSVLILLYVKSLHHIQDKIPAYSSQAVLNHGPENLLIILI